MMATERGRAAAARLMQDACTIATAATRTGVSSSTPGTTVYSGACRVQEAQEPALSGTDGKDAPAWGAQRKLVSIPISSIAVDVGDVVTITASAQDADLVGRTFRVLAVSSKTHLTARRLECQEVVTLAFATDRVTILVPDLTTDPYGNSLPNWSSVTSTTVVGMVEPISVQEDQGAGRDQSVARYRVWLPHGTNVTAQSRLQWQGLTLEVDGPPQLRADSTTGLPIEVTAYLVSG